MGQPPSPSIALSWDFPDAAGFCRAFESELSSGTVFVPCAQPPPAGSRVLLTLRVPGVGKASVAGTIARQERRAGGPGTVFLVDPAPQTLAGARALFHHLRPPTVEPAQPAPLLLTPATGSRGLDASELKPGEVIDGRFEIERHLASGGMSHVFIAKHVFMRRRVALKLLNRALADDPSASARFRREAEIVSQIDSPHIVRVFDFGITSSGLLFLTMELVEGASLDQLVCDQGALPPERAVALLVQVCAGLAAAHARGIIHRDLKPPNIMVARRPDGGDFAKILDFGIARAADSQTVGGSGMTRAGIVLGTPEYLSPEQALAGTLDLRSDLYSLGVVAFELLTGKLPFFSESLPKLISMHVTQPPPSPAKVHPPLAAKPELCAVVLKALRKEKEQRFPDANAFARALTDALQGRGPAAVQGQDSCPSCGADLEPQSAFCASCGAALRCPGCGSPARPGATFCPKCGAALRPEARGELDALPTEALVPLEAAHRRQASAALLGALSRLSAALPEGRQDAVLHAREPLAGFGQGVALAIGLTGLGQLPSASGDPLEAARLADRCVAALVCLGDDYGAILDHLDDGAALFLFDAREPTLVADRAARAALAMRETVQELRLSLPKGTPLGFKAALCAGTFDCPSDGRPARGEAAEAALELVERAVPNAVLLDTFAAEACGPRIDRRPSPDRRSFEVMGARPPPIAPLSRPVGRDAELREIEAALAGLSSGGVQAPLFILGAAGCGKSSLASELFNRARRSGAATAWARPRVSDGPFAAFATLVYELCGLPENARPDQLRPALESLKLAPALAAAASAISGALPRPPGFTPGEAAYAVAGLAAAVTQSRPAVLVFEGLDEADSASTAAFAMLLPRLPPRCLAVALCREEPRGLPPGVRRIALGALAPEQVAAVARELLGGKAPPEPLLDLLAERARGRFDLVSDWVLLLLERGFLQAEGEQFVLTAPPPPLSDAALAAARIESVGLASRRLFEYGCLLEDSFDDSTIEAALRDSHASAAWTRLERAALLDPLPGLRHAVRSQRHRAAALARSSGPAREAMHRNLAQALQGRMLDVSSPPSPIEIARHHSRGRDWANALSWWQRAVEPAIVRRDHHEAAARLQEHAEALRLASQARAIPPELAATERLQLLSRACSHAAAAGDLGLARAIAERAAGSKSASLEAQCEQMLALARLLRLERRLEEAAAALGSAQRSHPTAALAMLALLETGEQREAAQDWAGARTAYESALAQVQAGLALAPWHAESDLKARLLSRVAGVLVRLGDNAGALASFNQALEACRRSGNHGAESKLLANLASLAARGGRDHEACRLFEASISAAERAGELVSRARQLVNFARALTTSDPARARQVAAQAFELAGAIGWDEGRHLAQAAIGPKP